MSAHEQVVMSESVSLNTGTIDVLRQIRSNDRNVFRKQQELDQITVSIANGEARISTLLSECEAIGSETRVQSNFDEIDRIGAHLKRLDKTKARLAGELIDHKSSLVYLRERLENDLWLALVESGQVEDGEDVSDVASEPHEATNEGGSNFSYSHDEHLGDGGDPDAFDPDVMDHDGDPAPDPTQKAMSLLYVTKEELQAASRSFWQLDKLCQEQRREFESNMVSDWHGMSKTEFDLEQLAQRIELTRELIRVERAYSDAGRYAVEVGLLREDSDQSCHFVEYPDDGACSGDRYAMFVEEKDTTLIETWLEGFPSTFSPSPVSATGDEWEVDSIRFGEGCSTHADEWNKPRIERMEQLRALERENLGRVGIITHPDEMICQHLPGYGCKESASASTVSTSGCGGMDGSGAGLWKPSFAIMKELVVSGQAAVAKFSATWANR
jgi:hypothetical protein